MVFDYNQKFNKVNYNYDPNVLDDIETITQRRMEKSIQLLNPDFHLSDFESVYGLTNDCAYYKTKQITTTTTQTPTSIIVTTTTKTTDNIYLKYNHNTDIWEDISLTYEIIYNQQHEESMKRMYEAYQLFGE